MTDIDPTAPEVDWSQAAEAVPSVPGEPMPQEEPKGEEADNGNS